MIFTETDYTIKIKANNSTLITPSNEECRPFMDYAINCVSQSNSKRARELRLRFFENILCNEVEGGNETLREIAVFLCEEFEVSCINWIKKGQYNLIDLSNLI